VIYYKTRCFNTEKGTNLFVPFFCFFKFIYINFVFLPSYLKKKYHEEISENYVYCHNHSCSRNYFSADDF